jgi:DNA-binding YbaB/EbfC family protein
VTAEGPDLGDLLSQVQQMQQQLMEAQQSAAAEVVEGRAGGGMVTVKVTGGFEFQDVQIDPSVVDPADVDMLQDLVLAAIRDAVSRVNELNQQALGGLGSLLGGGPGSPLGDLPA